VTLAETAVADASRRGPMIVSRGAVTRCSFCGRRKNTERPLVEGHGANVCRECLRVCREILEGRAA
jgi:hypothetical protein